MKDVVRLNMRAPVVVSLTQSCLHMSSRPAQWAQMFLVLDLETAALSRRRQTAKDVIRLNMWALLVLSLTQSCLLLFLRPAQWAQMFLVLDLETAILS